MTKELNFQKKNQYDRKFRKRVIEVTSKRFALRKLIQPYQFAASVKFKSILDRDFAYILEYDCNVNWYLEKPLIIVYEDIHGNKNLYCPSFIVEYFDGTAPKLIEVVKESMLSNMCLEQKNKYSAAEEFCKKNGLEFCLVTDVQIRIERRIELSNYKFLVPYRDFYCNVNKEEKGFPVFNTDVALVRNKLVTKITIKELLISITDDKKRQEELLFQIWFMVANRFISANLKEKLTVKSFITK
ncbi:Tn7 transposase TnsA N-terminal domain-containing protein [Chryseobacterium sp. LC2016-29]|uniref:Tn7 transposase TnsA N-terminal domain-containing protein n=1 Tax=Chryseobacterium sp. LC2016-29 TaxID=2897331 RepID=UPI001E283B62|nr:Tn7 transposase TnsA N-terminal domain-containing protein [Chryseobacterium sp. LC2016-29]MCD0480394.1 Tn7 transposase TnsA N-terminal domain-containing protein [Chryseobacterium sp. LC2016-29]